MARKPVPKTVKKEIRRFVSHLREDNLPIDTVLLFGSYAKGAQRKGSDIDVCIVSRRFIDPFKALQYLWDRRSELYGLRIEPVGFHPRDFREGSSLTDEIKKTGIKIV